MSTGNGNGASIAVTGKVPLWAVITTVGGLAFSCGWAAVEFRGLKEEVGDIRAQFSGPDRWRVVEQRIWRTEMAKANPALVLPDVDEVKERAARLNP